MELSGSREYHVKKEDGGRKRTKYTPEFSAEAAQLVTEANPVRVCIGSAGRFHMFDLARQMQRIGHLNCLYTGYPRWKVDGLPQEKVKTFPWLMGPAT